MKQLYIGAFFLGLAALGFSAVVSLSNSDDGRKSLAIAVNKPVGQILADQTDKLVAGRPATGKPVNIEAALAKSPLASTLFGSNVGGSFDLIDHFGEPKQLEDYAGQHVLIFFGYANCLAICSAALPLIGDTINLLGDDGKSGLVPLMITVDPKNDTPQFMRKKLAEYHPALIGMTGSDAALADVRRKFQIRTEYVSDDIEGNPIYNHGSFIYLLGPDGKVKTLVPPILDPTQMAKVITKYMSEETL